MLRTFKLFSMTALIAVMSTLTANADTEYDYNQSNNNYNSGPEQIVKIDRYLDIDVWTNHTDNEFYEGDNIVLSFRANRDAFVAIYTIDTRGRVNLLFPSSPNGNNFVEGGETYRLPDHNDDFDFVVSGPEGVESIQIIASKERFPIPDWYPTSGLIDDAEDRGEFMDYINSRYFVRYDGQRFAFDRTSVYVNEWEDDYYRPAYYPSYPSWTVAGNVYIDYPYGGSVYVNGIYWGIAPLYIPRIYVGWHTFTVYDHYGYGWESDIHVSRYNTVVLNDRIIHTSSQMRSKYKAVRTVGYRNPVTNGYPKYKGTKVLSTKQQGKRTSKVVTTKKKYVRGSTKVVKTNRGYETTGKATYSSNKRSGSKTTTTYERKNKRSSGSSAYKSDKKRSAGKSSSSSGSYKRSTGKSRTSGKSASRKSSTYEKKRSSSKKQSGKSSTYKKKSSSSKKQSGKSSTYKKKSSSTKKSSGKSSKVGKQSKKSSGSKSGSYKKSGGSRKGSKSSGSSSKGSSRKSSGKKGGKSKR